ncbi:MAG: DUF58 domain-containing protein [Clostridiaceae bacterium]|nr:DUF58 domain-containing protein [Clostridiaceae bacterium]
MKRSRIRYLILLFLSFVYIYFDGGFLPYTLFFIVLLLPAASFTYLIIVFNTFKYTEKLEKREYQKGEMLDYTLRIHNVTPLYITYFNVYMHMEGQMLIKGMKNEQLTLKPFSVQEFKFNVPILYRGKYKVGISHIEVKDFLNLISVKYLPGETKEIRVFPRILPVQELDIPYVRMSENEYLSQNKDTGHTEIRDIRDYMYGDSFKKIHWKLSSKYNKWMVKETNASSEKEFWILLNLSKMYGRAEDVLMIEDRTVEFLVSLARMLLSSGFNIKLCFYRSEQVYLTFSENKGFQQIYELMSFIPFDQNAHFEDIMNLFSESMPERQSVMIFSPLVDEKQLDCLHKMAVNGHDISLFYCHVEESEIKKEVEKALEKELPELGIRTVNLLKNVSRMND